MKCRMSYENIKENYEIEKHMNSIIKKVETYSSELKGIRNIHEYLTYFLKTPGKRKRLVKLLAVARLTGGANQNVHRIRNALKLVNSTIFIHDDIIDHDFKRKGKPNLNKLIGYEKTLLVGNMLYFLAMRELNELECDENLKKEIISDFTHAMFIENAGQYCDVHFRKNFEGTDLVDWERMVLRHSGSYVISTLKAVAKLNGSKDIAKYIEEYEKNCTLAGAAEDALTGFLGNKKPKGDIKNIGFTILVHFALKKDKSILQISSPEILEKKIKESGAIEQTKDYIKKKVALSLNSLSKLNEGYDKKVLEFLVSQILEEIKDNA